MTKASVKTQFKLEKDAKELAVYNERKELMAQPGAMATAVDEFLMRKYGIYSKSTIWFIRKRVEERIKQNKD